MTFIQPVFIRKNTMELRKKLEEFGYKSSGGDKNGIGRSALYCHDGAYYEVYSSKPSRHYTIIDCGTNEELFLALAALRDDSGKNQYCIDSEGNWFIYNKTYIGLLSKTNVTWHKATVEEIIKHFKDN